MSLLGYIAIHFFISPYFVLEESTAVQDQCGEEV
jgi:hypothetical protein